MAHTIRKIFVGFPKSIGRNYENSYSPIDPFNNNWGRGIVLKDNTIILCFCSCSHAELKKLANEKPVKKGFYFGIYKDNLFLEKSSINIIEFKQTIIKEIAKELENYGFKFKI